MNKKEKYLALMPIEGTSNRLPTIKPGEKIPASHTIRSVEYKGWRWFHLDDLARVLKRSQAVMNDEVLEHLKERERVLGFFPVKEFDTEPLKMNTKDFDTTSDN